MSKKNITPEDINAAKERVKSPHSMTEIKEREKIVNEIDTRIVEPLGLLAGLMANAAGAKDDNAAGLISAAGNLIGLLVKGIRSELDYQTLGVDKSAFYEQMLMDLSGLAEKNKQGAENE